jgi:hypothetical protein
MNPENRAKIEANSKNHADFVKEEPFSYTLDLQRCLISVPGVDKVPDTKTTFERS